jgi:hypothetical protein
MTTQESPSTTPHELWVPDEMNVEALRKYWQGASPGWYAHPLDSDLLRYWDGTHWSAGVTSQSFAGAIPPLAPRTPLRAWERIIKWRRALQG